MSPALLTPPRSIEAAIADLVERAQRALADGDIDEAERLAEQIGRLRIEQAQRRVVEKVAR